MPGPVAGVWLALAALLAAPSPAASCTISPYPSARDPGATDFVGVATADTVLAGTGSRVFYAEDARPGDEPLRNPGRDVYGQVVRRDLRSPGSRPPTAHRP